MKRYDGSKPGPRQDKRETISVVVPTPLKVALEDQAWHNREPLSELVRRLLTRALELDVPCKGE